MKKNIYLIIITIIKWSASSPGVSTISGALP